MFNEKGVMTRLVYVERWVVMGSLHTIPEVHTVFKMNKLEWMARSLGSSSEEIVRELYDSYVATLRGSINRRARPAKQDKLTSVLV